MVGVFRKYPNSKGTWSEARMIKDVIIHEIGRLRLRRTAPLAIFCSIFSSDFLKALWLPARRY
jgi:hypothetical protein